MRVESSPRSRGRTPNGPFPTGVMFATEARASPVESGLVCAMAAPVSVSTWSGIVRISRSDRAAVTLTSVFSPPTSSCTGSETFCSGCAMTTVRAASEKPFRVTRTRNVPVSVVSKAYAPSTPVVTIRSRPVASSRSTTLAPGTAAPVASVTRPATVAAQAEDAIIDSARHTTPKNTRVRIHPPRRIENLKTEKLESERLSTSGNRRWGAGSEAEERLSGKRTGKRRRFQGGEDSQRGNAWAAAPEGKQHQHQSAGDGKPGQGLRDCGDDLGH